MVIAFSEVHHGRLQGTRGWQAGSPDAKASRADEAPDPEPYQARRVGLRAIPGKWHDARGRGTYGACQRNSRWTSTGARIFSWKPDSCRGDGKHRCSTSTCPARLGGG